MNKAMGIDVGGSGIKGAIVDVDSGTLLSERHRIETPQPATPAAVASTIAELVNHFQWTGPIGCGFPAAIQQGIVRTAANISSDWLNCNGEQLLTAATGQPFYMLNDADAAGMAELRFGDGLQSSGVVMMVTLGTGIGTALFSNGVLLPNTELGHLEINGMKAEHYASNAVRKSEDLGWQEWAQRVNTVLSTYHALFWPDRFVVGGGVSKKHAKFFPYLTLPVPVVAAEQRNEAGIIGAAVYGFEQSLTSS